MKFPILLFALLTIFNFVCAQEEKNKNLQSLIETEFAFARMAKNQNTRDAFLRYLSDETVMFIDSKITKGKKLWEERKPDSTLLIWEPVFADISASGDFGYTTGPSEYYPSRKQGEQVYYGSYITVWKKDTENEWKMLLDIGVYPQPKPLSKSLTTPSSSPQNNNIRKKDFMKELMKQEMLLIKKISSSDHKGYVSLIAKESCYLRSGMEPSTSRIKIEEIVSKEIGNTEYTPVGSGTSSAGDMGYVYGKVKLGDKNKLTEGYYLRIYKKEDQKDWKIVLDAIQ